METSDNTITEVLARLVALATGLPGSVDGATQAVVATAQTLGVDMTGAVLVDASGLGRGSLLAPRQLAGVLKLAVDPGHPKLRDAATDLAIGGLSGTLDARFVGDAPARGLVRAKTGSLPNVRSLAGTVVTQGNRLLVFVLAADQLETGAEPGASQIYDAFINDLASLTS
jgi:D-alanyl-D-alanine carboxypeptidase/D-alanyl-D-alanine-endopeptidase (penicillin-binding protein 4)